MVTITEKHNGNELFFRSETTSGKLAVVRDIYYRGVVKEKDGITYLLLYDPEMVPVTDAFSFLNFDKFNQSINSRLKAMQALKLLYCYQDIVSKRIEDFSLSDVNGLKVFLKGLSVKGKGLAFELTSARSAKTINGYLSVYRQYLEFLGITVHPLMARSLSKTLVALPDSEVDYSIERFKTNEKIPKFAIEVPKYISVEEFERIIIEIRQNYSIREEIIVRLMFQCGLRLGEVLGMTSDDLVMEEIDGAYVPVLYIRNRYSDQPFQNAKTCMKVPDRKLYRSKDYKTNGYGYQTVIIPEDLYNLINDYIEIAHVAAREHKTENYNHSTIADRVRKPEPYEDDNYYIFINSLGRPLSQISWNNIIRKIFKTVGIPVDKETRSNNLNHKFRHGFAMFNVQYLHCNELQLKDRLRHHSIQSVAAYFKPTVSDEIDIKTDFTETLYDVIPKLKQR